MDSTYQHRFTAQQIIGAIDKTVVKELAREAIRSMAETDADMYSDEPGAGFPSEHGTKERAAAWVEDMLKDLREEVQKEIRRTSIQLIFNLKVAVKFEGKQ